MNQQLRQYAELELVHKAQNYALTIDQYLYRITDTTLQITSRSRIRDLLEEYNQGLVSHEELVSFSRPKLADALKLSADNVGMTRLDVEGNVAIEIGDAPSWDSLAVAPEDLHKPLIKGPVFTSNGPQLLVAAPINDRSGQRVGTDLIAFSLAGLSRILKELNDTNQSENVNLAMQAEGGFHFILESEEKGGLGKTISPNSVYGRAMGKLANNKEVEELIVRDDSQSETDIVTYLISLDGFDWILSVSVDTSELYAIPNRLLGTLLPVIAALVLLGAVGSVLLLNPLAGKVIVQTVKYEEELRQRSQALTDLKTAHNRIDNIIKSSPNGLLVCDSNYRILLVNPTAESLFGFRAEDVSNQSLDELIAKGVLPESLGCLDPHSKPPATEIEFSLEQRDHSLHFIRGRCTAAHNSKGDLDCIIILLQDVTRDRELDQMKNEFISTAAHELRTPLTTLIGYTDMLIDPAFRGDFSEEQKNGFLAEVFKKGEVLSQLVDDLLDISRMEAGQPLPLHLEPCDILAVVGEVSDQFARSNRTHKMVIDLLHPPSGSCFRLDPVRIRQVVENLLSNAVKYSSIGSQITVSGKALKHGYQVTVSDEGIGISDENIPLVFDKFYRVDSSNTAVGGLGLGLSVVKQIIEGHNGEIHLESTPKKGTKVSFSVPMES